MSLAIITTDTNRWGIIKLILARESLVSDIPAGDGKSLTFFYSVAAQQQFYPCFTTFETLTCLAWLLNTCMGIGQAAWLHAHLEIFAKHLHCFPISKLYSVECSQRTVVGLFPQHCLLSKSYKMNLVPKSKWCSALSACNSLIIF